MERRWETKPATKTQKKIMSRSGVRYNSRIKRIDAFHKIQMINIKTAREKAEALNMLTAHRKPRSDKGKKRKNNNKRHKR